MVIDVGKYEFAKARHFSMASSCAPEMLHTPFVVKQNDRFGF